MNVVHCDICNGYIQEYLDPSSGKVWEGISIDFGPLENENFAICGKCRKAIVEYSGADKIPQPSLVPIPSDEITGAHWK